MAFQSETILRKGITVDFDMSAGLIDNLGELKLASDSVLHVGKKLSVPKQGKHFSVDRFKLTHSQISPNLYTKLSGGYLEQMFAGVGGEILYNPSINHGRGGVMACQTKRFQYEVWTARL